MVWIRNRLEALPDGHSDCRGEAPLVSHFTNPALNFVTPNSR
jgi:hypothetical protein